MNDQAKVLLRNYAQNELPLSESKLAEQDFLRIMQIVNCRWAVLSMELKSILDARRSELIG